MKKRSPVAVFLLSIITLGIYDLYWLAQTKRELNSKTKHHVPTLWLLFSPLLVLIAGYALMFVSAASSKPGSSNSGADGAALLSILLVILGFISLFIVSFIWFYKFSKATNEYTEGRMSTATTFLLLWLVHLLGVALIQDAFNDMIDGTPNYHQQPQSPNSLQPSSQTPTHAATTVAPAPPPNNTLPQ